MVQPAQELRSELGSERIQEEQVETPWGDSLQILAIRPTSLEECALAVRTLLRAGIHPVIDPWSFHRQSRIHPVSDPVPVLIRPSNPGPIQVVPSSLRASIPAGVRIVDLEHRLQEVGSTVSPGALAVPECPLNYIFECGGLGPAPGFPAPLRGFLLGLEGITASGEIHRALPMPRSSTGPDPGPLLAGGRGHFGLLWSVDLEIERLPERSAWLFAHFEDGPSLLQAHRNLARPGAELADLFAVLDPPGGTLLAKVAGTPRKLDAMTRLISRRTRGRFEPVPREVWESVGANVLDTVIEQRFDCPPFDPVPGWFETSRSWSETLSFVQNHDGQFPAALIRARPDRVCILSAGSETSSLSPNSPPLGFAPPGEFPEEFTIPRPLEPYTW